MKDQFFFFKKFSNLKLSAILFLSFQISFAQQNNSRFFSEAQVYFEHGVRYSNMVTVHFNKKIFDLPLGKNTAEDLEIAKAPADIRIFFKTLENKYGKFKFIKRVKNSIWGDTIKSHLITGSPVRVHDYSQLFTMRFNNFVPIDSVIEQLNLMKDVEYSDPPIQATILTEPNDLLGGSTGNQWNLYKINAPSAWDITKGSANAFVGMIEVAQLNHNGLPARTIGEFTNADGTSKFDPQKGDTKTGASSAHANNVAGIIGAATNDGDGLASLGWNLKIAPFSFSELTDDIGTDTFNDAVERAIAQGIQIINCSFITKEKMGVGLRDCYTYREKDFTSVRWGIADALSVGITVIAAAGNSIFDLLEGDACDPEELLIIHPYTPYPASYFFEAMQQGVIGISGTTINDFFAYKDYNGQQYPYNSGTFVDFCAPGKSILTVVSSGTYAVENGTSLASPQVAALVGLMKSLKPDLITSQIETILRNSVIDLGTTGRDNFYGYGRIDSYKALKYTLEHYGGTLTQSFTIPAGETWVFQPGITLKFASGVSITVNGTINATGTSTQPITFTSESGSTPGSWGYVKVQNGNSVFKYCTFQYAQYGLWLNNANTGTTANIESCIFQNNSFYGLRLTNSKAYVKLCEMRNNTSLGVHCLNSSDADFNGNKIYGNGYGGFYTGSGNLLDLYGNVIQNNGSVSGYYGFYTNSSDVIHFGVPYSWEGKNTIRNNSGNEVFAASGNPSVYIATGSIHDATEYEIYNYPGNSTLYTTYCYYDANGCQYSGNVNIDQPQNSLPAWDGQVLTGGHLGKLKSNTANAGEWFLDPNISDAEKVKRCKDIIDKNAKSLEGKNALTQLYSLLRNDYTDDNLKEKDNFYNYLTDLKDKTEQAEIGTLASRYMIIWKMLENNNGEVIELSNKVLNLLSGDDKKWVLTNLAFAYIRNGQLKEAKNILGELTEKYGSENDLTGLIASDINDAENHVSQGKFSPGEESALLTTKSIIPTEAGISQNYPNPFNPSTTINYQLPADGFVTLKVYDILGSEVASLVNEVKPAGTYNAQFNAGNLSSGVYIYRLKINSASGSFVSSKKMVVTK